MKTSLSTVAAFFISLGAAQAADWENAKFFPFEEAKLTYKSTGMQTGTQETFIRKYGQEMAQFQDMKMDIAGMSQDTKTASWSEPEWVYTYDYATNTGTKIKNPMRDVFAQSDDPREAHQAFLKGMGAVEQGTDTHNGTPCTVYQVQMSTMCISDDLIMQYTRMEMMGMTMNVELESVDIGSVDAARFEKPDVTYTEITIPEGMGLPGIN